jgi:hypothetical protein
MGGSAKAEERIFCTTNYFEELANFYPQTCFEIFFAGPELSIERHLQTHKISDRIQGKFFRGKTTEFLLNQFKTLDDAMAFFPQESSFFIGFNPGFGSGYDKLLLSWSLDILFLVNLYRKVFFT